MKAKKGDEAGPLKDEKTALEAEKLRLNKEADAQEIELNRKAAQIGNLVHDTVPDSQTEDDNALIRSFWPEGRSEEAERKRRIELVGGASVKEGAKGVKGLRSHHEVFDMLDGFDLIRGTLFVKPLDYDRAEILKYEMSVFFQAPRSPATVPTSSSRSVWISTSP